MDTCVEALQPTRKLVVGEGMRRYVLHSFAKLLAAFPLPFACGKPVEERNA